MESLLMKRLMRSPNNGKIAGVCAGLADYLDVDVTFVRAVWLALSIVPGAVIGGLVAYLLVWMIMPEGPPTPVDHIRPRLTRSRTDAKIAGVCGGLAEYFAVDPTPLRVLWIVLSILPGAFIGGLVVYLVAWMLIPKAPAVVLQPQAGVPA
jgi:phage shock protein PspC (stress-responsive transcriptional regulator)